MQMTINRQSARHRYAVQIAFRSVLIACLSIPLVAQSTDPSAQTGEPAKPAQKTPPFPRQGTDLETSMREQHEYMQWMHENNENVSTILVKLKPGIERRPRKLISHAKAKEIGQVVGMDLEPKDLLGLPDWQVLKMPKRMTQKAAEALCVKLKQHPDVLACDPNGAGFAFSIPMDPLYGQQWSFKAGPGSANIEKAWDITTGAASTTIAVLDSGITTHEDLLASRILPGYDFVTDLVVANDGAGRDAAPSDPGNWITAAESSGNGVLHNCAVTDSTWHGTHVMGTIGAIANNPTGVAGINWAAKLLPVRVLGKCGNPTTFAQDLTDAILWAAGIDIGTAPVNPNPAQVINMSLGGIGACPSTVQDAINQATAKGATVIAAAGNNNWSGSYWPASCSNVLTVVATDTVGNKESYSNWGGGVGVSAPGAGILSTVNPGTTSPVVGSEYKAYTGTSMAAAQVSGIASLMLAVKPSLTPFEIREIIKASAKKFASGSAIILGSCGSGSCGSGIVNAAEAVKQAAAGKPVKGVTYNSPPYLITSLPNGQVMGWGRNDLGQLGVNPSSVLSPAMVSGLTQVDRVFAGGSTSWSISSTGEAYALGQGSYCSDYFKPLDQCDPAFPDKYFSFFGGNPIAAASSTPVRTPILDNTKQITVGYTDLGEFTIASVFALASSGQVLAWGYDAYGLLGLGLPVAKINVVQTPTVVGGLPPIQGIISTWRGALALDQSGNVWGWGVGEFYPTCNIFGNGAPSYSTIPIQIGTLANVIGLQNDDANRTMFVAVKQDGTVWQWGCGSPTRLSWPTPLQIAIDQVVAASLHSPYGYAIRTDGSLWQWNYSTSSTIPTQILAGGARGFADAGLVRMADGHILDMATLAISSQSPDFGSKVLGSNTFVGRLNTGESSLVDTNLSVSIASASTSVQTGQSFDYLVSVQNSGPDAATNSGVSIALPTGVNIVSVPAGCSLQGQTLTCNVGTLNSGQGVGFSVNVQAVAPSSVVAAAYAYSDSYDYSSANNMAGVDVTIQSPSSGTDADVPTLPEWGVILMGSLLLANMVWVNRRKYRN